MSCHPPQEAGK